ncbi:molybdenum cofactor guanylyltransferase MobA [Jeongeupia naejangsanensis]|uniref:Molybdenum cofactor guanylyltransferase n=1 Tax=Jeongeupia naejangsanensis TaxID=613195 RepID=A0ABS2BLG4_9NEIS|nr:molybdenum cofactor guanylyltransferase MobA [Jeongeupia naejangsanensis]MBM3115928.1 molybdenum cofactor guanylyltransferase [Jeongeupia naejangsanensis]
MKIAAVILAGGEGRRMGGQDKGLLPLHDRPLVAWVLAALAAQTRQPDHVMISANRNLDTYRRYGVPVLPDADTERLGPLAGIHAALTATDADALLIVPCDVPMLPADLVIRLAGVLAGQQAAVAFADETIQPSICLVRTACASALAGRLQRHELRLRDWLASLDAVPVAFAADAFPNLNTPAALAAFAPKESDA